MNTITHTGVTEAAKAYDHQSVIFDELYGGDTMIAWKRARVRAAAAAGLPGNASVLELNAGTGEDAAWFAGQGHRVHATDVSAGMQEQLIVKMEKGGWRDQVTNEICSFTELAQLKQRGPFDLVFSNFGGLNCSPHLDKVLAELPSLLKPGGHALLVIMPSFCLWEFLMLFRGRFRTAFRRFAGKKGAKANLEGMSFRCWYYSAASIRKMTREHFTITKIEGLCTIAPPSYIQGFDRKYPRAWKWLTEKEKKYSGKWPWRNCGDYMIISLQRRS